MIKRAQRAAIYGLTIAALVFVAVPLLAQAPITFQYFYDDTGQLMKVVDSTGVTIDYVYDAVGNMLEIRRSTIGTPGGLTIFSFSPQQGGPLATVTIQGQGFSATPSANIVKFNGTPATVVSATSTTLVVTVPIGATTGPISVTVSATTASSSTNFTGVPLPAITSLQPKGTLSNATIPNFQVTGVNLTGSSFSFLPASSPPSIAVSSIIIDPNGSSATMSLSLSANATGKRVLVATNATGSSDAFPSAANTLFVISSLEADSDGDGVPDGLELQLGTDPFDPTSTPKEVLGPGEAVSLTFSLLNAPNPSDPTKPYLSEAVSSVFSLLNAPNPSDPTRPYMSEAVSLLFSVLNSAAVSNLTISNRDPKQSRQSLNEAAKNQNQHGKQSSADQSPPAVNIIYPAKGETLMEGETVTIDVDGSSSVGPKEVDILVNGVTFARHTKPPYELVFTIPAGVSLLTFGAVAKDSEGGPLASDEVVAQVKPALLTTVRGQVVNSQGVPVNEATVVADVSGLQAEFFDFHRPLSRLPDLTGETPVQVKLVSAINLRNPHDLFGNDPFGVKLAPDYAARFSGWMRISQAGTYRFILGADEGANLALNGKTVIHMPAGSGQFQEQEGTIFLSPGLVPIEVTYYESLGTAELQLSYVVPGGERQVVPPNVFIPVVSAVSTTSDILGQFSIPSLPAYVKMVRVAATGGKLGVVSKPVPVVPAGITEVGKIVLEKQGDDR